MSLEAQSHSDNAGRQFDGGDFKIGSHLSPTFSDMQALNSNSGNARAEATQNLVQSGQLPNLTLDGLDPGSGHGLSAGFHSQGETGGGSHDSGDHHYYHENGSHGEHSSKDGLKHENHRGEHHKDNSRDGGSSSAPSASDQPSSAGTASAPDSSAAPADRSSIEQSTASSTDPASAEVTTTTAPNSAAASGNSDTTTGASPSGNGTDSTTPTSSASPSGTGAYVAGNGEILSPNGQVFTAKGVNIPTPVDSAEISTLFQNYPDTNMIRLNASDTGTVFGTSGGSVANIESTVSAIEAARPGTVVEIEDHTTDANTSPNTLSGSALATEDSWYSQLASNYKNDPNVWFGTPNEPMGTTSAIDAEESSVYNAIRSTGNQNPIMLENMGGDVSSNITGDPSAFSKMTNVVYDAHFYQAAYGANDGPNNPSTPTADLQGIVSADQSVSTGDPGTTPVIVGEYGPSTKGTSLDSNGYGFVGAAQSAASSGETSGALAWVAGYNPNPQGQELINPSTGQETTWGAEVGNFINNGVISNPMS